jgi:hypothetical protein
MACKTIDCGFSHVEGRHRPHGESVVRLPRKCEPSKHSWTSGGLWQAGMTNIVGPS